MANRVALVDAVGRLLADRGFNGDGSRALLAALGAVAVALRKSSRKGAAGGAMEKYRKRHRVENFFCWIKHFRRTATRCAAMIRAAASWFAAA